MSKLIEKKRIKTSSRGITFSFKNSNEEDESLTQFDIGQKYIIDIVDNKMVILPSINEGLTVSRKKNRNSIKPLFDIRNSEALEAFSNADYLQVSIYDDKILVEGYVNDVNSTIGIDRKVKDITSILKVRKISEVEMSHDELDSSDFKSKLRGLQYPMKVVSVFSSAGILDKGFTDLDFEIVFAIEKCLDAVKTYKANNTGDHIVCGDVCTYPKEKVPFAKIIIGGPSCTPFSFERFNYGTEEGSIANHKDSKLIYEYIQWIKSDYASYDIFVLENVPGLLKAENSKYVNMIKEELSDFEITTGIVNDLEQGGYQKRNRAFIIGSKIGRVDIPSVKCLPDEYLTVKDALDKVDESWPNYHDVSIPREDTVERMKYVPQGGNWRDIPLALRTRAKHSNSYKRLAYDQPCITIVNYRKPIIIHPERNRILTVSEAAALTGLEKDFEFKGSLSSKQQQVGNAVPLSMGKAIAKEVIKCIDRFLSKRKENVVYSI